MRSASRTILTVLVAILVLSPVVAAAQAVPGATADERAVNGAKAYMKSKNLTSLKLNMMMPSIFTAGSTGEMASFEKATGIGVNYFEVGILQIQAKAMSEAVAKSGSFDFWIGDPISLPDLVEAGLVRPIDDLAARGKPDFDDVVAGFVEQGRYKGKTYGMFGDGDNWIMVIRKDLIDAPGEKQKFKAKYGWEPGCPDTYEQWYQLAEFFTRDPKGTGVPELYGAMGYRARGWGWRWWLQQFYAKGGMPFDDTMKPLIAGKEGVEALKDYIALTKFMPKDILGWATPQAYPFFAGGNAFSIMTYPSIAIAAEHPEKSKIAGKNRYCLVPGYVVNGKLVRRSLQGFGNLLYVSNYSKHPEAAYWLAQYLTSKEVSARLVSGPNSVWDPYMKSHLTDSRVIKARTKEMLEVHLKNAQVTAPMILIQGAVEYNDVLDQNVQEALLGKLTPEDALNRTAAAWEKITNQLGRKQQIEGWKALKPAFPTKNVPD
ncbi:MAG TPA: extracellular solute-binding protein [Methylomirabilota bacterium]|nr:extracellular solute-binding protein [Methylomirabilota bacterium]